LGRIVAAKHFLAGLIAGEAKHQLYILWSRNEGREQKKKMNTTEAFEKLRAPEQLKGGH
jgi:hypothetical protein